MMEPQAIEPKREPLHFDVVVEEEPSELAEVILAIKKIAEQMLYHWQNFPIVLPPPLAILPPEGDSLNRKPKPLNLRDLFVAPSFDELDAVALDGKGKPRRLNEKQLRSISKVGEFEVESLNFPGHVHRWRVSQFLQKGTDKIRITLLQDVALALQLLLITAQNRIHSHFFSLSQSVRAFLHGLLLVLDAIFGVPSLTAKHLDVRIREERSKYLVAELNVRPNLEDDLDNLCQFIKHQIRKQSMEKYRIENENPPAVPCLYQTPKGHQIDLRLFNKELIRRALPTLAHILEKEARGWFLPFREKTIAELKTKKLSEAEVERLANIAVLDEYLQRVFSAIKSHPEIKALGIEIGELLVEQAHSVVLMHRAVENVQGKLSHHLTQLKQQLEEDHPVLSRIGPWVREQLENTQEKYVSDHQLDAHEEALILCRENHLDQTVYFLNRDLSFMREREPVLKQELSRVRNPTRVFHWRTQIWCPHHWRVRRVFQGESDIVPTVISQTSSSLAQPRSDPNQPVYLVEKQVTHITTTRFPFWRWSNYCHRTWAWLWNTMFLLGIVIPWCSPISLRALFSIRPFMPDLEVNQLDGTLYPRKSSLTHTLCSRLLTLWRHISKSRTEFESRPDTGFIGKGLSRHLNRIWNYVVKGIFGTLLIVFAFPCLCLVASGLSLGLAVLAPAWVPASTLLFHFFMILGYDFDSPDTSRNKICFVLEAIIWHIVIQGLIQPVLALIVALVACPLLSLAMLMVAIVRCSIRFVWDGFIFHVLIKKRGRVPAADSWMVHRIEGPGLSNKHFFKITPEQALAAFEAKMESEELGAFREEVEREILQPQLVYSDFVRQCFGPFSGTLSKDGVYRQLEKETQDLLFALRDHVDRRKRELQTGLSVASRSRVKLTAPDLQLTVRQASIMVEKFFPTHVLQRLINSEEAFWEHKGLPPRDWPALAAQMLAEVFSADFLTPLEDTDTCFKLEVVNANLSRYTEMLRVAEQRVDIDVSSAVHTPKGNIHVHAPYLDLTSFNPMISSYATAHKREKKSNQFHYPWKKRRKPFEAEKLLIPLPIPHPAEIAVIIFNRENEEPIPLETDICGEILKAIVDGACSAGTVPYDNLDNRSVTTTTGDDIHTGTPDVDSAPLGSDDHLSRDSHSCSHSRRTSGSIVVNLASSEDITLEPDGQRVTYSHSSYSTTV